MLYLFVEQRLNKPSLTNNDRRQCRVSIVILMHADGKLQEGQGEGLILFVEIAYFLCFICYNLEVSLISNIMQKCYKLP